MKIMMLSWEYPPKNVGGISAHSYHLSQEIKNLGHEVHVITCEEGTAPVFQQDEGVFVHRVIPYKIDTGDFTKWVMHLNYAIIEKGIELIKKFGRFDIIHAHDWLSAYSARVLKCSYSIPMVCTIHATEHGRNGGIWTDMQRYISSAEWMLHYEAWKIITCSYYMRQEVHNLFGAPWEKIWVIPNGVDAKALDFSFEKLSFRRRYAQDHEKIIFYVGRHVFEKGIHLLVEAGKRLVNRNGNIKFIIAGTGPMSEEIKYKAECSGIGDKFIFTGYIDADTKNKLYKVADSAIFPSLYEPFGIVALEAMAAGCPVIASDVGGLSEIIEHRNNGMKAYVGSANSLADNLIELFENQELAGNMRNNALKVVKEKYTWNKVAILTVKMYKMVKIEAKGTDWE
jgi:glycogen synthase